MCVLCQGSPLIREVWPEGGICCTWGGFWRTTFRVLNTIIFVVGLITIGAGVWSQICFMKIENILVDTTSILPIIIIIIGCLMLFVAAIAIKFFERPLFMFIYSSSLMTFFFLEMTIGVVMLLLRSVMRCEFERGLQLHLTAYTMNHAEDNVMDKIQTEFSCCGNKEPFDWLKTPVQQVPSSCCKVQPCDTSNLEEIYKDGCFSELFSFMTANTTAVSLVLLGTTVIPLLGTMFAFCLALNMIGPAYSIISDEEQPPPQEQLPAK